MAFRKYCLVSLLAIGVASLSAQQPPEITTPVISLSRTESTLYWNQPYPRSTTLYGSVHWTARNLNIFDAHRVNDGDTVIPAFNWQAAGPSSLDLDVGAPRHIREFGVTCLTSTDWLFVFDYSDDEVTWVLVPDQIRDTPIVGAVTVSHLIHFDTDPGAHRYWRMRKVGEMLRSGNAFTEVSPREYTDVAFADVKEYRVYSGVDGSLLYVFPGPQPPAPHEALDINSSTSRFTPPTNLAVVRITAAVTVTVVSSAGIESNGAVCFAQKEIPRVQRRRAVSH